MSLQVQYGAALRRQLGHFPIWDVGTPVSVGDYGVVEDNCFRRLGNVADDFDATVVVEDGRPSSFEFETRGTSVGDVLVKASSARLEVAFESANSLYIRAPESVVSSARNIAEVAAVLKTSTARTTGLKWQRGHCFVSSVRRTPCLTLLMNTSKKSSIVLKADAGVLALLHGNRLLGSSKVDVTGDAGLKSIGVDGGIYVDLVKTRLFRGPTPLGATEDENPFEQLDPNKEIVDGSDR